VFVAALQKGVEGDPPVVAFSRHIGMGARWRNPAAKSEGRSKEKDDRFERAIREERGRREAEEANRLLYVAMTRAEQRLVLSFSGNGKRLDNWAERVAASLHLNVQQPCDETLTYVSPYEEEWPLRVLVADRAPELLVSSSAGAAGERSANEWLPRPQTPEQHDGNVTVTALAEFACCPRRYFLGEYLGFTGRRASTPSEPRRHDDPPRELPADEFGTQVHELLAGKSIPDADPEAIRLADRFRSGPLGRCLANATRIEREFDFLLAVQGVVVRGQIDLWFEEGGRLEIVDYKTDDVPVDAASRRAQDYALQLRVYAMAIERLTGRAADRAWLHFLRPNVVVEVDLAPSLLDAPEQAIGDFVASQESLEFPLHESDACLRCSYYRGLCPAGTVR
jgi:ATP-dependent exoDNAse (exonuclease V) beta subunit